MAKKKYAKYAARARRRARELAVQFLYSMELRPGQDIDDCLGVFVDCALASNDVIDEDVKDYMLFLASGVWRARSVIDDVMRKIVTGWRLERMVAVDRAVLRVAIFEGFIKKEVPVGVAISEAVDIASAFGTEDSGRFVNGVLAKVLRSMENMGNVENVENNDRNDSEDSKDSKNSKKSSEDG